MCFQNGVDRLFFSGVDKGAGIDYEHIGLFGARSKLHAALEHTPKHDFSVAQIFGAAETDDADFRAG